MVVDNAVEDASISALFKDNCVAEVVDKVVVPVAKIFTVLVVVAFVVEA